VWKYDSAMDVLLVDDHPIIHETMRAILRSVSSDATFHGQFDLAAGLSQASRLDELQLVLLDLSLPGCSGMEAFFAFRRAHPKTRVAVISATEDSENVQAALDAGKVKADTALLVTETAAGKLALLRDQMAYHHIAQGTVDGKNWMATF